MTTTSFEEILEKEGMLVYTNVGTSMLPLLRQGKDLLIIKRKSPNRLKWLDVPLFKRRDGKYIMHRVMWVCKDTYVMCGDNQWYLERGVQEDQILGVLTAVQRDGKTYQMDSPLLRFYGYVEFSIYPFRAPLCFVRDKFYGLRRRLNKLKSKN